MSLVKTDLQQCCAFTPIWIFVYADGGIFAICDKDSKSPAYQNGVTEIINLKTQESFTPEQFFGGPQL